MFGKSIELFKLRGLSIRLETSWIFLAVLITWSLARGYFPWIYPGYSHGAYWLMGAVGALGLFLSILLHELSHSAVARREGIPVRSITLFIFGGVSQIDDDEPRTPAIEAQMALAGPALSILMALVSYVLSTGGRSHWPEPVVAVLNYLTIINLVLAFFNLVPAFPLDGGRVLRAALWHFKNDFEWGTRIAAGIGSGFGILLATLGILTMFFGNFLSGIWWILIGMFLRDAAAMSYQQSLVGKVLKGEPIRRFMQVDVVTAHPDETLNQVMQEYLYWNHHIFLPVLADSNRLLGCLNISDIKRVPEAEWGRATVSRIMQPCNERNTVAPDTEARKVIHLMRNSGNSRLVVAEGDRLLGVVSLKDLLRYLASRIEFETYERKAA